MPGRASWLGCRTDVALECAHGARTLVLGAWLDLRALPRRATVRWHARCARHRARTARLGLSAFRTPLHLSVSVCCSRPRHIYSVVGLMRAGDCLTQRVGGWVRTCGVQRSSISFMIQSTCAWISLRVLFPATASLKKSTMSAFVLCLPPQPAGNPSMKSLRPELSS